MKLQRQFTLDECWLVKIGKLCQPKSPPDWSLNGINTTNIAGISSGTIVMDKRRENYKLKLEKYEVQMADLNEKCSIIFGLI